MDGNPISLVDPLRDEGGDPAQGTLSDDGTQVWGVNANTGESEWSSIGSGGDAFGSLPT